MLKKIQYDDIECGEALATEAIDAIRELITISKTYFIFVIQDMFLKI